MSSVGASSSLGPLVHTYAYDPDQRSVTLFVGLGMFGIAIAFPVLYWIDPVAVGILPIYLSPLLVAIGIGCGVHWVWSGRVRLEIHEGGFVYRGQAVPWSRVRGVRYKLVEVVGGSASYNRGFCKVRLDDGSFVVPTMQLESMDRAIGAFIEGSAPVLGAGFLAALGAGEILKFGPYELAREGVRCKGTIVPWARAAFTSSGYPPHLSLLDVDPDSGDSRKVHEAKTEDVESADVVERLGEQLRVEAIRSR